MKPIIVDMKEMSDSVEVYESRPHPFFVIFIYVVLGILVIALGWMYFSKMDIVVKGNGIFKMEQTMSNITNELAAKVVQCNVTEGQFVKEDEVLYQLDNSEIKKQLVSNQEEQNKIMQRIQMAEAYLATLNGDDTKLSNLAENPYYQEYMERNKLLQNNEEINNKNVASQKKQYENTIASVTSSINYYEGQVKKLQQLEQEIKNRKNTFSKKNAYYYAIVESYLSSYKILNDQYNTQIKQIKKEKESAEDSLKSSYEKNIKKIQSEKKSALYNVELEQLSTIQQQLQSVNNNIVTLNSNLSSAKSELESMKNGTLSLTNNAATLTEKNTVYLELQSYKSKQTDYSNTIESLQKELEKSIVKATSDGFVSLASEITVGSYLSAGTPVCSIIPDKTCAFKAELYVSNQDVAKLKEGQTVKFEISAYPSSEYGSLIGKISSISKDVKVDQSSGSAYYLVQVAISTTELSNTKGDTINLMQGMACQGKVIVYEKRVLTYLLEKIDLID